MIPPYKPEPVYTPPIKQEHAPKDDGIVVEEIDTSQMTRTGIQKAFDRMTGKFRE